MPPPEARPQPPQFVVFWVIWFAILSGLFMLQLFAAGGLPSGKDQGDEPLVYHLIALGAAIAAAFIRFGVIPRIAALEKKLPLMIVGLALAEGIGIVGMFVVPSQYGATKLAMLIVSVICVILQAPVYAKPSGSGNPFVGGSP